MKIKGSLISKCVKKDRASQKALYEILLPYLAAIVRRYLYNQSDVQDALQESFVNIFSNIEKYEEGRSQFQTWAVKITINTCLKLNTKMNKMPVVECEDATIDFENPSILRKLSNEDVLTFLKTLPPVYFTVFNLHLIEGFSHQEIAELLKIDITLSRKRLSRARVLLKQKIKASTIVELDQININDL